MTRIAKVCKCVDPGTVSLVCPYCGGLRVAFYEESA
jgi:hypothetical protein